MVLKITMRTLDYQNYQFEAQDDWIVAQFKEHISDTVSIEPSQQRLIFCGRVLQNERKLSEIDCHEKVIHLVRRPPPTGDVHDRDGSANNSTAHNEGGSPSRTGDNFRFGEEGNMILSAVTGVEGDINDLDRQILTLQQRRSTRLTMAPMRSANKLDSCLVNLKLTRGYQQIFPIQISIISTRI